jgi:iron complex outermembrane recepter protein
MSTSLSVRRSGLLVSAGILSLAIQPVAYAQVDENEALPATDLPRDDEGASNEIVVTATKREQTLQDVPVAVSVTTAQTIERAQIRDIRDLASVVPSLRVTDRQSSQNATFFIRGFGNGANNLGIEPSVGTFIDGVYRSRSASSIADLPDVQRVEVLRGPQSTLFGKNASAGVVSVVTREPEFNFGGNVEVSYGNFDAIVAKGRVTGPVSDSLAFSLAAGINKRDGYYRDLGTGNRTNERNRWFVRGQALFEPNDQLKVRIIGDYGKIDENCCAVVNLFAAAPTLALISPLIGGQINSPADPFGGVIYGNLDSTNNIENYGVSGQVDWRLGPATVTSITAYRRTNSITNQDSDFTSADLLQRNFQDARINTFTQELRLNANFLDKFNLLLGAFYFNETIDQANEISWGTQARAFAELLRANSRRPDRQQSSDDRSDPQ